MYRHTRTSLVVSGAAAAAAAAAAATSGCTRVSFISAGGGTGQQIGNGVLIGAGACLLGDITIGTGTQIGAGSLVVTDLPERCVGR